MGAGGGRPFDRLRANPSASSGQAPGGPIEFVGFIEFVEFAETRDS